MDKNYKRILSLFAWLSLILFVIRASINIVNLIDMILNVKILELIYDFVGYAGEAILIAGILLFVYDKCLWRVLNFWKIPVLEKEYIGKLISCHDDKERVIHLTIAQSFLSIKIKMKTDESLSVSICESLDNQNGVNILTYTYFNKPDSILYNKSKMHYGTAFLNCDDPKHLKGDYYTDRKTFGSMKFDAESKSDK